MPGFPLYTRRLMIRPLQEEDADGLHVILGDPRVMSRIPSGPSKDLEQTKKRLLKIKSIHDECGLSLWGVFDRESGEMLGNCGIHHVEGTGPEVEISYQIAHDHWGKGIASEAAEVCLDYGLNELNLDEILAMTFPDHVASMRVMENAGMVFKEEATYYDQPMIVYSIRGVYTLTGII